tara:strand:- start:2286 stop:2672 length:387 start_codon:yes stop_codon:yes gene_type:complete
MKNNFNLVWKTHDFIVEDIVNKESSFEFMFKDLEELVELFKCDLIEPDVMEEVLDRYENNCLVLINLYKKHIQVLSEIKTIIQDGNQPPGGDLSLLGVSELSNSTQELIQSVKDSILMLKAIKKKLLT